MKILITGSRGGIGLEAALQLAERKHEVIATVHSEDSIALVQSAAQKRGVDLTVEKLNILNIKDRERALVHDVDVLINNAATGETGPLIEVPIDRLRKDFETNVFATLELSQQFARKMLAKENGKIVFIGSLAGRLAMPFMGPYVMTKFALEGAIDALRLELRPLGIKVCLIEPGAYATGFNEKMHAKKYEWMGDGSAYHNHLRYIRMAEQTNYRFQSRNLVRIARQIVRATEARRPKARYVAPWWQGLGVRLIRIFT
jgi:short-subunit dehydrogenase